MTSADFYLDGVKVGVLHAGDPGISNTVTVGPRRIEGRTFSQMARAPPFGARQSLFRQEASPNLSSARVDMIDRRLFANLTTNWMSLGSLLVEMTRPKSPVNNLTLALDR